MTKCYENTGLVEDYAYTLIMGDATEILAIYKGLVTLYENGWSDIKPLYAHYPRMNVAKTYAIVVDGEEKEFHVVTADVAKSIISNVQLEEVTE